MKSIKLSLVRREVQKLIAEASFDLPSDITTALKQAREKETNPRAIKILELIIENRKAALSENLPLCQDCGTVYIDLYLGPGIFLEESERLEEELNGAVGQSYRENYLRRSIVSDPLYERKNTGSNTPAIINTYFSHEPGIGIKVYLKGGGSENCSYLFMENPSIGEDKIIRTILDTVKSNITKCCPPVVVGIGIGSTASGVTSLARIASFRELDIPNPDKRYHKLEEVILKKINDTGIGPQGLGGKTTALGCNIEYAPCHIATLPLAVFFSCHSTRRASSKISPP